MTLKGEPTLRRECSELLDSDLSDVTVVLKLLVRDAITRNEEGTVLVSSTNKKNLAMACDAAVTPLRNEAKVARMIRDACVEKQAN